MVKMLLQLQEVKVRVEDGGLHPGLNFQSINDGFGNSIQHARPFIEHQNSKKMLAHDSANPFLKPSGSKKLSMQETLDAKAKDGEDCSE